MSQVVTRVGFVFFVVAILAIVGLNFFLARDNEPEGIVSVPSVTPPTTGNPFASSEGDLGLLEIESLVLPSDLVRLPGSSDFSLAEVQNATRDDKIRTLSGGLQIRSTDYIDALPEEGRDGIPFFSPGGDWVGFVYLAAMLPENQEIYFVSEVSNLARLAGISPLITACPDEDALGNLRIRVYLENLDPQEGDPDGPLFTGYGRNISSEEGWVSIRLNLTEYSGRRVGINFVVLPEGDDVRCGDHMGMDSFVLYGRPFS